MFDSDRSQRSNAWTVQYSRLSQLVSRSLVSGKNDCFLWFYNQLERESAIRGWRVVFQPATRQTADFYLFIFLDFKMKEKRHLFSVPSNPIKLIYFYIVKLATVASFLTFEIEMGGWNEFIRFTARNSVIASCSLTAQSIESLGFSTADAAEFY